MRCALGLGASEDGAWGSKKEALLKAIAALANLAQTEVLAVADILQSEPLPYEGMPDNADVYLNTVLTLDTELTPETLLKECQRLEAEAGRNRAAQDHQWASRPLDIDLILGNGWSCKSADLTVPHPRALERNFVMLPLAQVAADWTLGELTVTQHIKKSGFPTLPVYLAANDIFF